MQSQQSMLQPDDMYPKASGEPTTGHLLCLLRGQPSGDGGLLCLNAPLCVTSAATIYALRAMIDSDIPLNSGCLVPIELKIPTGSLLNPSPGAAVCGGNVLTSQRITDVIFRAFKACAASQGALGSEPS